jgi:hypothetical protein
VDQPKDEQHDRNLHCLMSTAGDSESAIRDEQDDQKWKGKIQLPPSGMKV